MLDNVVAFRQFQALSHHDGVRQMLMLYGLDNTGALWKRTDDSDWARVEQPPQSSAHHSTICTKGAAPK